MLTVQFCVVDARPLLWACSDKLDAIFNKPGKSDMFPHTIWLICLLEKLECRSLYNYLRVVQSMSIGVCRTPTLARFSSWLGIVAGRKPMFCSTGFRLVFRVTQQVLARNRLRRHQSAFVWPNIGIYRVLPSQHGIVRSVILALQPANYQSGAAFFSTAHRILLLS
jgi:hypothetical protein